MMNDIRIISAATTNYMREMKELPESLKESGLKHTIIRYYNAKIPFKNMQDYRVDGKLWIANVNQKLYFLLHCLDAYPEKVMFWTDWDSEIINYEWLIQQSHEWINQGIDIAVSEQSRACRKQVRTNLIAGTIFAQNNDRARWFLNKWIDGMENIMPECVDESMLNYMMQKNNLAELSEHVTIGIMPRDFCQIFDNRTSEITQPAFVHNMASRTHNKMNQFVKVEQDRDYRHREEAMLVENNVINPDFKIENDSLTIVGSAASAKGLFWRVPKDSYKVALNIAVMIPDLEFDAWLCVDHLIPLKPWFPDACKRFKGQKIFRWQAPSEMAKKIEELKAEGKEIHYSIKINAGVFPVSDEILQMFCLQSLRNKSIECVKGEFRNGGTVAGFALQLAWYLGVKKIFLIGVEMKGNAYAVDGDSNPHHFENEVWEERVFLQNLINTMKADGVEICTLSPTTLDIEYPEGIVEKRYE